MKNYFIVLVTLLFSTHVFGQSKKEELPANWYNLDYQQDGVMGVSTEKAYELLSGRKSTPVIVGVLDGGVDIKHEDLKNVLWVNKKEVADDGKDNDGNGYIDDIHGWNFLGNPSGENVDQDNLEVTRLIKIYEPKYLSVLPSTPLSEKERREFVAYQKMVSDYTDKMDRAQFGSMNYSALKAELDSIVSSLGKKPEDITKEDVDNFSPKGDRQKMAAKAAKKGIDEEGSFDKFYKQISEGVDYFTDQLEYHLNKDFDARAIVGDNYEDSNERYYGNNDVAGPDAQHGTHVAGIIGAERNNDLGINGVANNVQIMAVRMVPNGDEHDKDVANGIRYAVDNGAKVINMSFGKGYVFDKNAVDQAIKYAMEKDVLLIHAAGNDGKDIDISANYPTKYFTDSLEAVVGEADNYITVGATAWKLDRNLVADFSNYGYRSVDLFAPGVRINSTVPDSKYEELQGTSMAAPVVAGVAAMIRSYYPELSAKEVREILLKSVTKVDQKVIVRNESGQNKRVFLDEICVSGGIVNAYNAVAEADKYMANKK